MKQGAEVRDHKSEVRGQNSKWRVAIRCLLWWGGASLVAIGLLEVNALLGLGAAIVGGVVFGILLFAE